MTIAVSAAAGAIVAVLAMGTWIVALRRERAGERAAREAAERLAEVRQAEVVHVARVVAPAIAQRLKAGERLEGVPGQFGSRDVLGADFHAAVGELLDALRSDEGVRQERVLRDSVQSAFETVARTMHRMATVQQGVLDGIGREVSDGRLMGQVMQADHAAAQMILKAQTLLVMCGIWPARRETRQVSLYDCVRGAMSRIVEYERVRLSGGQNLYAVAPAVEGLMHILAELLQNATVFSPPTAPVTVTVREVAAGAVVEIDDEGLGMAPEVLEQASARLHSATDLTQLGAVPRLGLSCVGRWARELGVNVELSGASAYGGTRVVVFVPYQLLTDGSHLTEHLRSPVGATAGEARAADRAPGAESGAPSPNASPNPGPSAGPDKLPQRRSRRPGAMPGARTGATPGTHAGPAPAAPPPEREWTPQAARASIAGVVAGSRSGREALRDPAPGEQPRPRPDEPTRTDGAESGRPSRPTSDAEHDSTDEGGRQ